MSSIHILSGQVGNVTNNWGKIGWSVELNLANAMSG